MDSAASLLTLGFALGLRHALDADHLAAVATIVARNHRFRSAARVGALWGLGHTASLLGVALFVILSGIHLPEAFEVWTERGVAVMLAILGGNLLWRLFRGDRLHNHPHHHGPVIHTHPHFHAHGHEAAHAHAAVPAHADHGFPVSAAVPDRGDSRRYPHAESTSSGSAVTILGIRPFLVGLVHGMAGSGALMLLVAAAIADRATGLLYVMLFGLGSTAGMLLMSALLSVPIQRAARRSDRLFDMAQAVAAVASLIVAAEIALR